MIGQWREALGVGLHFMAARQRLRLSTRARIEQHQQQRWRELRARLVKASPFYADYGDRPFAQWPMIDKARWMQSFDAINTAGIRLAEAMAVAEQAEASRDFRPAMGDVTVGLSTGTSGARGVFLASGWERRRWAGTMLAKLLPDGLLARERVALLLRAGSNLYETVRGSRLQFRYVDLMRPFASVLEDLQAYGPTLLVGPAQVLALVADAQRGGQVRIAPRRVISTAEVLHPIDRARMERTWAVRAEEIYQATEGFLGHTCSHGVMHLNEDGLIIERDWLDRRERRFVPIITDLYRTTQPVVRYRLNDILVERSTPCECGSPCLALDRIEGREDDIVWLTGNGTGQPVALFPDTLARCLLNAVPEAVDFRMEQVAAGSLAVALEPPPDEARRRKIVDAVHACCHALGAVPPAMVFKRLSAGSLVEKQRRVRGYGAMQGGVRA